MAPRPTPTGLHPSTRERLVILQQAPGPFTVPEAAERLGLDRARTRRLLGDLARGGWLTRVHRGLYAAVPFDIHDPHAWREDAWRAAERLFAPCYIGGFTALHHWQLTDQVFRTVVVFTARPLRRSSVTISGADYLLRHRACPLERGVRKVWRDRMVVYVSDPEATLADVLDDPAVGGGMRHIAECLEQYWNGPHTEPDKLLTAADARGNRTIFKRLGYVCETLNLGNDAWRERCRSRLSRGVSLLDPTAEARGPIISRWQLRANATIAPSSPA